MRMMPYGSVVSVSICMLGMLLPGTPTISAGESAGRADRIQIRQRKERIARNSQTSGEVMLGAIQYIDQISSGRGTAEMKATRDRYLSLVHATQSKDDEPPIDTEQHLHDLEVTFYSQTERAMKACHGRTTALWQAITAVRTKTGLQNREQIPGSNLPSTADPASRALDRPQQQYQRQFPGHPSPDQTRVTSLPGTTLRTPSCRIGAELTTLS
jgi:hypothetical protein